MSVATIDIGSNSIRLLVGDVNEGVIIPVAYEREATRLAGGISKTHKLNEGAMESTVKALKKFQEIIGEHDVADIRVFGTSALREADNTIEFLNTIKDITGMEVDVIDGQDEASLTTKGVTSSIQDFTSALVMDIGGGSTEFVFVSDNEILDKDTLPFGVVKLYEDHITTDPPSNDELHSLNMALEKIANKMWYRFERKIDIETVFIGTAGTATTLACIDMGIDISEWQKAHIHKLHLKMLRKMSLSLLSVPESERLAARGLDPDRADLIRPGILLTIKVMSIMGFKEMIISNYGLLEGAFLDLADKTDS
jgi:exopolyphosphatase/guanosine-5'-triphosphate,3'-diphosphate pyrophosphatase